MSAQQLTNLTEGPVPQRLRQMALPMMGGFVAAMLFYLADTFFVAQLGATPLAGLSFTLPVQMVLDSVGLGLGVGISSVLARVAGSGDRERVPQLISDGLLLTACLMAVLVTVAMLTIDPLFLALGAPPELLPEIRRYIVPVYLSIFFLALTMTAMGSLRSLGNSRIQARNMMIAAAVNLVLDPILIFGLLGAPRLELLGAGLATLAGRVLVVVMTLWIMARQLRLLTRPSSPLPALWANWRSILAVALPASATNAIVPVAAGVMTYLVARHGPAAVAGLGVATRVELVALMTFFALAATMGPFAGQNLGARLRGRIDEGLRVILWFALGYGLLVAALIAGFSGVLAQVFSDDPAVREVAQLYFWIVPVSYGCYGVVMTYNATFNGLGKPHPAVVISASRVLLLYIPLALLGDWLLGLPGLFAATAVANVAMAVVAVAWLRRTVARLLPDAVEQPSPPR